MSFASSSSSTTRRTTGIVLLAIPVLTLLFFWSTLTDALGSHEAFAQAGGRRVQTSTTPWMDFSGLRVAIQDAQSFHEEVFGAALYSFNRLGAQVSTYHPEYRAGFTLVEDPLWAGRHRQPLLPPSELIPAVLSNSLDLVVITSGDHEWLSTDVLRALERAKGTQVVLILHQMEDFGPERETLRVLATEGRLTLVGLGEVVTEIMSRKLLEWATRDADSAWDKVAVELFVPIFPLATPGQLRDRHDIPSKVVIQGGIVHSRRRYHSIIADLRAAILADPSSWGYHPLTPGYPLRAIDGHPNVFTLHLLGFTADPVDIPVEMANVIVIPGNTDYKTYFDDLATMDLLLPAFASSTYLSSKTSSSIPAGILAGVPILASSLHLKVYEYLQPPAAIPHPSSMTEVEAIRRLRERRPLWDQQTRSVIPSEWLELSQAVDRWDEYRTSLYDANEDVWHRVAHRLTK